MALAAGTRLGPYEIAGKIGAGGMGDVYRARDVNLGRDVAIKVLPDDVAHDADRLARFEREAKTLASLNHPNIAIIHGLEKADGIRALVMELVEGPTLADRIEQGPIPTEEALPIARQIAEALEAAHEQGIIHRDLKPANVKLRPDGAVKVLDFGLAKTMEPTGAMSPGPSISPTITSPAMTQAGMILGTAAYMSPEQAKGRAANKRSDIWAFGCVLYEMLTGERAFEGEDVSDTLASVLRSEPDWAALPADVPPPIVSLIKRSLEKDGRRRIGDVAVALFVLKESSHAASAPAAVAGNVLGRYGPALGAAAVIVATGAAVGWWWLSARFVPTEPKQVTRFVVTLRADEQFTSAGNNAIALSPDGKHLAYLANQRLNLRAFAGLESVPVRGTQTSSTSAPALTRLPFFSPDGQWVGFLHDGQIKKISIHGGAHVAISPAPNATAFAWEDDGTILFAARGSIWRVSEAGGTPEVVVEGLDGQVQSLQLLPGKRAILFTRFPSGTISGSEIVVQSLDTGDRDILSRSGIEARYLPTGHIVYYDAGTLLAVPYDLRALAVTGAPVPVADAIASAGVPGRAVFAAHLAISRTGTLAYVAQGSGDPGSRTLVWVDRAGREELLGVPDRSYVYPRLSPDGSRLALTIADRDRDIEIWNFGLKNLRRFTSDPATDRYGIWTPDGKHILFGSNRGDEAGTWRQAADGSGVPERVAAFPITRFGNFVPTTISPDGSRVVVTATGAGAAGGADLWMLRLTGDVRAAPLLATTDLERNAEISPNGRWMAYESVVGDRMNVWVRPFPDVNGGLWQVSPDGGSQPLWAPSGKELFFRDLSGALMSVPVEGLSPLVMGTAAKSLDGSYVNSVPTYAGRFYDVSQDGQRFLMLKQSGPRERTGAPTGVTVVLNWFEELKQRVPTK